MNLIQIYVTLEGTLSRVNSFSVRFCPAQSMMMWPYKRDKGLHIIRF